MNRNIVFLVLISFIISISVFFIFQIVFQDESYSIKNKFYSKESLNHSKKIFLLGSSHVGQSNATHIEAYLAKNSQEYSVYNLAETADKPKNRLNDLNRIILLNPDFVVYGVGYYDFLENKITLKESILPDPQSSFEDILSMELYGINTELLENPKLNTLKFLQGFLGIKTLVVDTYFEENTPFFPYHKTKTDIIVKQSEIEKNDFRHELGIIQPYAQNKQVFALNQIIREFNNNDIPIIFFITPHNEFYYNSLSSSNKERFNSIIGELSNKHSIEFLNLTHLYKDMEIWRSTNHVTHNFEGIIYSEDIAKKILMEIND